MFRYKTGTFAMIRDAKRLQATRSNPPGQAAISELGGVIGSFLLAVDVDAASLAPAGADNSQGPNPLAPRPRRGTDIRHMTLQQFRYFRDVALAGQLPDSQSNVVSRGQAPLRNEPPSWRCPRGCTGVVNCAAARARRRLAPAGRVSGASGAGELSTANTTTSLSQRGAGFGGELPAAGTPRIGHGFGQDLLRLNSGTSTTFSEFVAMQTTGGDVR